MLSIKPYNYSVNQDTANRLLSLNRQFYQTFAVQFSATRQRLQPGVQRILGRIPLKARILDLGCGNGELWRRLVQRSQSGVYVGLDFSEELLAEARQAAAAGGAAQAEFIQADLSNEDWEARFKGQSFEFILAFAVLHHIPSNDLREQMLARVRRLLPPGGQFILSTWQFLHSQRMRGRLQPWEQIGLNQNEVDPGDFLLDWRSGGLGLRYVHHFTPQELGELALRNGFRVVDSFTSDGESGNLGLYQVWEAIQ